MTRYLVALAAAALFAMPATVLACAMEFEIPEELEETPDPDSAALVALMEEIDMALEQEEQAPIAEAHDRNATKRAQVDAVQASAPKAIAPQAS